MKRPLAPQAQTNLITQTTNVSKTQNFYFAGIEWVEVDIY